MKWDPTEIDHVLFPKLDKFLKNEFCPRVVKNKVVWKAFKEHSKLDNVQAKTAVEFGKSEPLLVVDELPGNGRYKKSKPDTIFLDLDIAIAFEDHPQRLKRVVESTVLHEMVHWGRHHDGDPKTKSGKYNGTKAGKFKGVEAGKKFECSAYGGDISMNRRTQREKIKRKNIRGGKKYRKFECPTRRARNK
jgi:hypothetical protein